MGFSPLNVFNTLRAEALLRTSLFEEYEGENAILELDSVDFQITIKDIYAHFDFDLVEE